MENNFVHRDPWRSFGRYTQARIALGRAGSAIPTKEHLALQLAEARARDAVNAELDVAGLAGKIHASLDLDVLLVKSRVRERKEYLMRPDLGRRLDEASIARLDEVRSAGYDVVFVTADGLSAPAVDRQAEPFLRAVLPFVREAGWTAAPIIVAEQGRVALADEIGELLNAKMSVILIGERPGLTYPTSMGIYFTYGPRLGLTDERRNCISNVHNAGLSLPAAARKLFYLMSRAVEMEISGIELKDETAFEIRSSVRHDRLPGIKANDD